LATDVQLLISRPFDRLRMYGSKVLYIYLWFNLRP